MHLSESRITDGNSAPIVRSSVYKNDAVGNQPIVRRYIVVCKSSDNFAVIVPVIRKSVGLTVDTVSGRNIALVGGVVGIAVVVRQVALVRTTVEVTVIADNLAFIRHPVGLAVLAAANRDVAYIQSTVVVAVVSG